MNISDLRLYPDPEVTDLVHAIAAYYGMNDNQVFVGVGSDDVLSMCFLTFFNSDKPILFPNISYSFYSVWADLYRIPYEKQPLDKDFNIIQKIITRRMAEWYSLTKMLLQHFIWNLIRLKIL